MWVTFLLGAIAFLEAEECGVFVSDNTGTVEEVVELPMETANLWE
jgi:hypothetical protein